MAYISFYSDYFKIGKYYYTIVSLLSTDVQADLPAFWSRWIEQGIEDIDYTVLKKYRKHTFSDNEKKNVDKMFVKMNKRLKRRKITVRLNQRLCLTTGIIV
uniref:Uncharacterized protein n=1 Tax=Lactococcus lactis subsp. cremoris TaxID=1359 RepID=A0A1V0PDI0_LACLC